MLADGLDGLASVGRFADDFTLLSARRNRRMRRRAMGSSSVTNTRMDMSVTSLGPSCGLRGQERGCGIPRRFRIAIGQQDDRRH